MHNPTSLIRQWVYDHQNFNGRSWNGHAHLIPKMLGMTYLDYVSVIHAYSETPIRSRDAKEAPAGAIHFFTCPPRGHIAIQLHERSDLVLTTGSEEVLTVPMGNGIGLRPIGAMQAVLPYAGWSMSYGRPVGKSSDEWLKALDEIRKLRERRHRSITRSDFAGTRNRMREARGVA